MLYVAALYVAALYVAAVGCRVLQGVLRPFHAPNAWHGMRPAPKRVGAECAVRVRTGQLHTYMYTCAPRD
jgi:hypothetical protein